MLEKIRKRLLFEGADAVGGAYLKGFVPDSMQNLEYGISVQMRLSQAVVEQIFREKSPSHTYFHNYRTLNAMLDRCTFLAVSMLQRGIPRGGCSRFPDGGPPDVCRAHFP